MVNGWKGAHAIALGAFGAVFLFLTVSSYTGKSATWDEPHHLVTGYAALTLGDYRLDPEHPPLLRMWAALPLLLTDDVRLDASDDAWQAGDAYVLGHEFLYRDNDADRLLGRARLMTVLLGLALGVLLWSWAREWFGDVPALGVLALYTVEPNLLAHSRLVTTDLGLTVAMLGTVYTLWRTLRRFSWPRVAATAACFALAIACKYTAIVLLPVLVLLVLPRLLDRSGWPGAPLAGSSRGRVVGIACVLLASLAAAWLVTWASHGFRYRPTPAPASERRFITSESDWARDEAPRLASFVDWIDRQHLVPNAASQGFLFGQLRASKRSAYFAGSLRDEGWWFYFPAAIAIKTPVATMLLALAGLFLATRRRDDRTTTLLFLVVPPAVLLIAAMTAALNIGLRHVLPVYPMLLLASGPAWCWLAERRRSLAVGMLCLAALELAWVYPHYLSFFNVLVGGPSRGHHYLVDSNLDWGQDLSGLRRWMDRNDVEHVNLSYRGTADPDYYGINCTHLPGAPFFAEDRISEPRLPGYVAVSATNLHGVYLDPASRDLYEPLLEREPDAVIGHSIHVYRVERPWW